MKNLLNFALLLVIGALNACGTQVALSGKAYSDYQNSLKPYSHYWQKPGVTLESRRQDSWNCGAGPTIYAADHVIFPPEVEKRERRAEEEGNLPAYYRLSSRWVECMKAKGYVWTK